MVSLDGSRTPGGSAVHQAAKCSHHRARGLPIMLMCFDTPRCSFAALLHAFVFHLPQAGLNISYHALDGTSFCPGGTLGTCWFSPGSSYQTRAAHTPRAGRQHDDNSSDQGPAHGVCAFHAVCACSLLCARQIDRLEVRW